MARRKKATTPAPSRYSPHPGFAMETASRAGLLATTGRPLERWVAFVNDSGPAGDKARLAWLRAEHGLGLNYAGWIVAHAGGRGGVENDDPEGLVAAMFAGPRAALRPIHERLLDEGLALGDDVKACPGKTIVPLDRRHVFAQIKPASRTRIDLGLALADRPATGRLIETGGLDRGDRITHRVPISRLEEIDDEVLGLLQAAYDRDAPG